MSPARESFVLPPAFLTVALLGGLRTGATVRLLPPPVVALVLGMLLLSCLIRAGALDPLRLVNGARRPIENLSGAMVLACVFAASVQIFNLLTPELGLLHVIFAVFFFVQLLTMVTGVHDRASLLRAITVLLGSAFVLRFVVLESLYAPGSGTMKRVLTALMEGVTLGTLQYEPNTPATAYAAFFALTLFLIGLALLPAAGADRPAHTRRLPPGTSEIVVPLLLICVVACADRRPDDGRRAPGSDPAAERRAHALRAAHVWYPPAVPIASVAFAANPAEPGAFRAADEVACRFVTEAVGGGTPKFNCDRPDGERLKVKYGSTNPEVQGEVVSTRLLAALGFGADRMYVVRRVNCYGCPAFPFQALTCLAETGLKGACFPAGLDYSRAVAFDPAVIERPMQGNRIQSAGDRGWAWFELDRIDPSHGGSPRREVDALRLIAVFLAHWDNKSENQRLICLPGGERADGSCARPFAYIQDVGATFGPFKLDLPNWRSTPLWVDARSCRVSMKTLPFGGGTFPDAQISEEGRQLLLSELEQLSDAQVRDLFESSQVSRLDALVPEARNPDAWVAAFRDKVRQMREAGPCPPARTLTSRAG